MTRTHVAVVGGGGAAGLSAALTLGRSRRRVLVLDTGEPRNATSPHAHNLLTHDGTPPAELLAAARAEVEAYGVEVRPGRAVGARPLPGEDLAFEVTTDDGATVTARRVVVATGQRDRLPDVPGLAARWGRDALHCPYCHGWEVRDRPLVVLADTGPSGHHRALLVRQLSEDVTLLLEPGAALSPEAAADLSARDVRVVQAAATGVQVDDDALTGIVLDDGTVLPCDAVFVAPYAVVDEDLLAGLGLAAQPFLLGGEDRGRAVQVDPVGATSVPGVWAAGNVTGPHHALPSSIAAGSVVGAMVNWSLVESDVAAARR